MLVEERQDGAARRWSRISHTAFAVTKRKDEGPPFEYIEQTVCSVAGRVRQSTALTRMADHERRTSIEIAARDVCFISLGADEESRESWLPCAKKLHRISSMQKN